jgi:hypothetical protein
MKRNLIAAIRHTREGRSVECGLALKNLLGKNCVLEATGHSRAAAAGREDRQSRCRGSCAGHYSIT